jgi:hypothetical protein
MLRVDGNAMKDIKKHAKMIFSQKHGRILRDDGGVGEHDKGVR